MAGLGMIAVVVIGGIVLLGAVWSSGASASTTR
jgi:hypothetical protein